ncbi:MAG: hypothetical protein K0Q43_5833 [Ramlibacter sp.]|nr:hypothetical protein [Ramlibacter sp.]
MKPVLALLLAAACTMSHAQTPTPEQARQAALSSEIRAGTATPDHLINVDGYEWEIYVDKSFNPPIVVPSMAMESIDRLLSLRSVRKQKALMLTGRIKALNYARQMRGEPLEAVPTDAETKKMFEGFPDETDEGEPVASLAEDRIRDCPERFSKDISYELHRLPGPMYVFVDQWGRPEYSNINLGMIVTPAPIYKDCQAKVGKMGGRDTDEGGHAVGARLGGWGKRANLTPQDGALNKSYEWKQIDATVDLCAFHGYEPSYTVKYFYNDNTYTNRPQIYNSKIYVFIPGTCPPDVKWDDLDIMNRNPTPEATLHRCSVRFESAGTELRLAT